MMKNLIVVFALFLCVSCEVVPFVPPTDFTFGGGAFIVNEGNFNSGNGSLSYYSYDSLKVINDLFFKRNNRPVGDVPNSMAVYGDKAYIIVNNSGKIEVADRRSLRSTGMISGLRSPRNMAVINDGKAYVTSLWSDSVTIVNLYTNKISGYIGLGRSTEAIIISGTVAYISSWMDGTTVTAINNMTDQVIAHIEVGPEPESMVLDRNFDLWVLCTGGWRKEQFPELVRINTLSNRVEKRFPFPSKEDSPTCLRIDGIGQNLFYLEKGVRQMDISAQALPEGSLISSSGNFYKLGINPVNSDIIVTDAADYVSNGSVIVYKNNGTFVSENEAGIIPGDICFNITMNNNQVK